MELKEKLQRIIDINRELEVRKALYGELEKLTLELVASDFREAEMGDLVLTMRDHFSEKNVGWTRSAVVRFEVEVITKALSEKRKARG
jgi:hypothetical protein